MRNTSKRWEYFFFSWYTIFSDCITISIQLALERHNSEGCSWKSEYKLQLALRILGPSVSWNSTNHRSSNSVVFITVKSLRISGTMQFKSMLFNSQLYYFCGLKDPSSQIPIESQNLQECNHQETPHFHQLAPQVRPLHGCCCLVTKSCPTLS